MLKARTFSFVSALIVGGTVTTAFAADVKIGVIAPLSGPSAVSGISMKQAYEAAAAKVNDAGGLTVNGTKSTVQLIFEDSAGRPEVGVSAAQKLFTRDQIDVLVGDTNISSVTLAIMEVGAGFGKFIMSGQPVSIEIANKIEQDPKRFGNVWKSTFNSDAYAKAVFDGITEIAASGKLNLSKKRISFIYEDTEYGKANVENATKLFKMGGWTVLSSEAVPPTQADFYPQISKIRSDPPDVIVSVFVPVNSGIALVRQLKEQDIKALHLGIYYPIRPEFLAAVRSEAEGMLWAPLVFDPEHNPSHNEFSSFMKDTISVQGNGDHLQGYCQMSMLLDNIGKANSLDASAISKQFAQTDFKCPLGRYVFNQKNHTPLTGGEYIPVPVAQIQDGVSFAISPSSVATSEFKP